MSPRILVPLPGEDPVRHDRSDGLDLLRDGFALWVMMAHLIYWTVVAQGPDAAPAWLAHAFEALVTLFQAHGELNPAVLGFIVLSGYCIHRSGLRRRSSTEVTGYAVKRTFRILPLYYIGIAAGLIGFAVSAHRSPAFAVSLSGTPAEISGLCLIAKALAISAVVPGLHYCVFLGNAPLVTVMVEIILYAIYAGAFVFLIWRGRERAIWGICAAVFLGSLALFAWGVDAPFYGWWQDGSVYGFLPYWWVGVLFVNPAVARAIRRRVWAIVLAWAVLTLAMSAVELPAVQAVAELRKLLFALAVGVAIHLLDGVRAPALRPLTLVGRAGYSIYALHAPLTYTLVIYGVPWWATATANVLLGIATYRLIERPLVGVGRAFSFRLEPSATSA